MKQLAFVSLLLVGCALVSACGDDEEEDGTGGAGPTSGSTSGTGATTSSTGSDVGGGPGSGGSGGSMGTGGLPPGDWDCVGSVEWPAPAAAMATITAHAQTLQGGSPLANLSVTACAKADTDCATPITTGTTDGNGDITLTLPTGTAGFDGFFEVTGADIPDGLLFVNPPVTADMNDLVVPLIDNDTLGLLGVLGIDPDPTRGHVAVIALDCANEEGEAISISCSTADAQSTQIYTNGQIPDPQGTQTDDSGASGIFNVPTGPTTLTAKFASTGDTTGSVDVFVRADTFTYATLPPTP